MNFFKAALAIIYIVVAGYGFLRLILKDKPPFSVLGLVPLAFVAGFGLLGFWGNLIMLARQLLSFWLLALPFLPLFIYGLLGIDRRALKRDWRQRIKQLSPLEILLLLVIIFGVVMVFVLSVEFPLHFWDSRAIWGMKAQMLFGDRTIFSPNFLDPNRVHPHFRYPLFFPLAQAFIYFALGQIDDWAVMLLVGLFFPLLVGLLYDLTRLTTNDRTKALIGAAALAVMPVFFLIEGPAYSGFADTPLALFFLAAFALLFVWKISADRRLLLLGCILSAFLPLVKNDGTSLLALNFVWVIWPAAWRQERAKWLEIGKRALLLIGFTAVVLGSWYLLRHNIPDVADEQYANRLTLATVAGNFSRVPAILSFFGRALLGFQPEMMGRYFVWGGLWLIVLLAAVRAYLQRAWLSLRIFCLLILFFLFMTVIYIIAPQPDTMISNFFRVSLSVTPLAILLVVTQSASPLPAAPAEATERSKGKKKK
jgi:hypothetical protein